MKKSLHTLLAIDVDFSSYNEDFAASLYGFNLVVLLDQQSARDHFLINDIDIVLLGHNGDLSSIELLKFFKSVKPSVPVIIIADNGCEALVVSLFRNGARDYFKKPFLMEELRSSIDRVLAFKENSIKEDFSNEIDGLERAIRYIDINYTKQIRLPMAAHEAGMSVSHFEREFKSKMETTFVSYVNDLRINRAIKLLADRNLSIHDIAFASGFTSQCHFNRIFKKTTCNTPTFFRSLLRK